MEESRIFPPSLALELGCGSLSLSWTGTHVSSAPGSEAELLGRTGVAGPSGTSQPRGHEYLSPKMSPEGLVSGCVLSNLSRQHLFEEGSIHLAGVLN